MRSRFRFLGSFTAAMTSTTGALTPIPGQYGCRRDQLRGGNRSFGITDRGDPATIMRSPSHRFQDGAVDPFKGNTIFSP